MNARKPTFCILNELTWTHGNQHDTFLHDTLAQGFGDSSARGTKLVVPKDGEQRYERLNLGGTWEVEIAGGKTNS